MKNLLLAIIAASGMCAGSLPAQSRCYYVSPWGDDANTGRSVSLPFATIAIALRSAAAGDTVYLLPGRYRELVTIAQRTGAVEHPLCLYSYDPAQRAVIDGGASVPSNSNTINHWMHIDNSSWIEIGNIEFRNGWTNPIRVSNSSYVTFTGCVFYGGKRVIDASGANTHHLLVQNCYWDQGGEYVWTLVTDPSGADAWTSMHEGLLQFYNGTLVSMIGTTGSCVIRNNTIMNCFNAIRWSAKSGWDSNIEIYDNTVMRVRDNDFEPEYYTFNLHIHHNRSHNIHKTMSVDHVAGGDIYYYGNLITSDNDSWSNSVASGFWKIYGAGTANLSRPMYIFNNSFCGVGKAFTMDAGTIATQVKHFNNAYNFTGSRGWVLPTIDSTDVFDHDISNKPWPATITGANQEKNGLVADIQYRNVGAFDLRLQAGSPGLDKGETIALPELGWTQSFTGAAPDIGAYEGENLLEGPPFRFRTLPELTFPYAEKPRIVRSQLAPDALTLWFSAPLDASTVSAAQITVVCDGSARAVTAADLRDDGYRLVLGFASGPAGDGQTFTVSFDPLPKGTNGETATMWAAALPSYKQPAVVTAVSQQRSVAQSTGRLQLDVYPNPVQRSSAVRINLPPARGTDKMAVVRLYDILGRVVEEMPVPSAEGGILLPLTWSRYVSGMYFVSATIGGKQYVKKISVIR